MPIYEYYCPQCHLILNFFARSMHPDGKPTCPHCKRRNLSREISIFAAPKGGGSEGEDGVDDLPIDESRMERAVEALAGEAESMNEDDPRAAARLMRKFSDMTGLAFNEGMETAIERMEAGEDPEAIEAEMGDLMDSEDPFVLEGGAGGHGKKDSQARGQAPKHDPELYDW